MTRLNRAVLAALTGAATGFLAWNVWLRVRRQIRQGRSPTLVQRPSPAPTLRAAPRTDDLEARLDEALEESFPASDPVSIRIE